MFYIITKYFDLNKKGGINFFISNHNKCMDKVKGSKNEKEFLFDKDKDNKQEASSTTTNPLNLTKACIMLQKIS